MSAVVSALPPYSVLMSVYAKDASGHLDAAIASMVEQTVPFNDFVLVCDGPLTDDLYAVVAEWEQKLCDRMRVVRLFENRGLGVALNAGISECGCDIVARMDSDDVSRPERMAKLLRKMVSENLDLVGGAIEEFDKMPGDMGFVRMPPQSQIAINAWSKRRNPFNHMSVVFDRRAVKEAGGYQSFPWLEDYWLWVRMISKGCSCANVSDVVVDVGGGNGMIARRSTGAYLKSQVGFSPVLRGLGFINRFEQAKAILQRTAMTALPGSFVRFAYSRLLRERRGQ